MIESGNQDAKETYDQQSYWDRLPFCSKAMLLVTVYFAVTVFFYDQFMLSLVMYANHVHFTIAEKQYWRLFTSFFVNQKDLGFVVKLVFLGLVLPHVERAYSTPYTLIQIFLQTFLFNLCFAFVGIALASSSLVALNFFGFVNYYAIASLGVTHLIFIFIWARVVIHPERRVDIYGLPLRVKVKYLPWCFFAIFSTFGPNLEAVIGFILGYLQYMVLKRSIFCLPKSVYKFIELLFPKCTRPILSYVSLLTAQRYLAILNEENAAVSLSDNINQQSSQTTSAVQQEE